VVLAALNEFAPSWTSKEDRIAMLYELLAIHSVLNAWKNNPKLSKREIGIWGHWKDENPENDKPISASEVERMKSFFREQNPTKYYKMFPEDHQPSG
jgi:hypothetical protein